MPVKTLRLTVHQPRDVGAARTLDLQGKILPRASWLTVAGGSTVRPRIPGLYPAASVPGQIAHLDGKVLQRIGRVIATGLRTREALSV